MTTPDSPDQAKPKKPQNPPYSEVLADRIIEAIEELLTIKAVSKALDISPKNIYAWRKRHPEFNQRLLNAQRQYYRYRSQDAENIGNAKARLNEIFEQGWIVQRKIVKEVLDRGGNLVKLTTNEVVKSPPPDWAFQRILGGNDETTAIKTLASTGWIPDEMAVEILEIMESGNGEIKDIFRSRFKIEDL